MDLNQASIEQLTEIYFNICNEKKVAKKQVELCEERLQQITELVAMKRIAAQSVKNEQKRVADEQKPTVKKEE